MAIIQDPKTDEEKSFSIPLASEKFFEDIWEPLAEELELQWIPTFLSGVDVIEDDLDDIVSELEKLEVLAKEKLNQDNFSQLQERIKLIKDKLPGAFKRVGAVVFIG